MQFYKLAKLVVIFVAIAWVIYLGGLYGGRMIGILIVAVIMAPIAILVYAAGIRSRKKLGWRTSILLSLKEIAKLWFK